MAFGSLNSSGPNSNLQTEINMVPLIDVMLVLLVIFMITAPLLSHSIAIDLPKVSSQQAVEKPDVIDLAVDAEGQIFWNNQPLPRELLQDRLHEIAGRTPQPNLNLRADRGTRYEILAEIMGEASRAGVNGIGFVTTPSAPRQDTGTLSKAPDAP